MTLKIVLCLEKGDRENKTTITSDLFYSPEAIRRL